MTPQTKRIVAEALDDLERTYQGWLTALLSSETEREKAQERLKQISEARAELDIPRQLPCTVCGMIATADPQLHLERYGHAPRIRHGNKLLEYVVAIGFTREVEE